MADKHWRTTMADALGAALASKVEPVYQTTDADVDTEFYAMVGGKYICCGIDDGLRIVNTPELLSAWVHDASAQVRIAPGIKLETQ